MVDERSCNGNALLLTAGEKIHFLCAVAFEVDKLKHFENALFYLFFGRFFQTQTESNVFIHIKMGKKSISLEHGVDVSLIGRKPVDALTLKENITACRFKKSADYPERSRLAAA